MRSSLQVAILLLGLATTFASTSCAGEEPEVSLIVQLVTDFVPAEDFAGVETEISDAAGLVAARSHIAVAGQDYLSPVRVGDFEALSRGGYSLSVRLIDTRGTSVAERPVVIELDASTAVTVPVQRACDGVSCPSAGGNPAHIACYEGRCVDPACSPETPELCGGTGCADDDGCADGGRCVSGGCFYPGCIDDASCGGEGRCLAGECIFPACDDGNPCTQDQVVDGVCASTPMDGASCDDGVFCNGLDRCAGGSCTVHDTPPCPADRCDEAGRQCDVGCSDAATDCPDPITGEWSTCAGFDDVCDDDGMRSRMTVTFDCVAGRCVSIEDSDSEACTRSTDGVDCGGYSCGAWRDDCRYPTCETEGTETRRCDTLTCSGGRCRGLDPVIETRACPSRPDQEGMSCMVMGACSGTCRSGTCSELCEACSGTCVALGGSGVWICSGGSC